MTCAARALACAPGHVRAAAPRLAQRGIRLGETAYVRRRVAVVERVVLDAKLREQLERRVGARIGLGQRLRWILFCRVSSTTRARRPPPAARAAALTHVPRARHGGGAKWVRTAAHERVPVANAGDTRGARNGAHMQGQPLPHPNRSQSFIFLPSITASLS